jgi:hypothetical protein
VNDIVPLYFWNIFNDNLVIWVDDIPSHLEKNSNPIVEGSQQWSLIITFFLLKEHPKAPQ